MEKVLIVGTGALANLFGARLSAAGIEVVLLGTWQEGLAALGKYGVRVVLPDGETMYPVSVAESPEQVGQVECALVLVKSWQTPRAARQLAEILSQDGVALTLQNGLGNREVLERHLGDDRVALGVTTSGATLIGPGQVRPGGEGVISVGEHPRLSPLLSALRRGGFEIEKVDDVEALLWRKLLINVAINPLTAILRVPNGSLLKSDAARQLMALAVQEVVDVSTALNVQLGMEDPVAEAERVAQRTAGNRSSMLQDITRGAPTEIEAICGAVVQAGIEQGVPTPVNQLLLLIIRAFVQLNEVKA